MERNPEQGEKNTKLYKKKKKGNTMEDAVRFETYTSDQINFLLMIIIGFYIHI